MSRVAVLGRVAVSAVVLATLLGVAIGVFAGGHPAAPDGVVQCAPSGAGASVADGCPTTAPGNR